MKKGNRRLFLFVLGAIPIAWDASARQVENWTFKRLFEESDCIVIAEAANSTDTGGTSRDNPWEAEFTAVDTTFKIRQAIKGDVSDSLTLFHYRTEALLQDGPSLVLFRTKGISYTIVEREKEGEPAPQESNGVRNPTPERPDESVMEVPRADVLTA